jgi:hypothetical protein
MNSAGNQLLSRPGLTNDQNAGVARATRTDPATDRGRIFPPTLVRFETQFAFSRYLLPNLWQCDRRGCQADGVLLLAISMLSLDALIESL